MSSSFWKNKRVLITSGPTREFLDPIRFLTNASSGQMGWALAREALRLGAQAIVVSGPVLTSPPPGARVIWVQSALQMREKTLKLSQNADAVIAVAAVVDWRLEKISVSKIKRNGEKIRLTLLPNPDIIKEVGLARAQKGPARSSQILVGFALETNGRTASAEKKLREKGLDMIIANSPASLSSKEIKATLIFKDGRKNSEPAMFKSRLARVIFKGMETV